MAPRQGHRKSRNGCQRCKQRKVKCDEQRPICGGCTRYPKSCIYITEPNDSVSRPMTPGTESESKTSTPSRNEIHTPYSDIPIEELDPDRRRALELLLMHHFETSTVKTFPSWRFPFTARKWLSDIMHMALEYPFLLHAIFAVTSLHLALHPLDHSGPNHTFDFGRTHRIYLNMATHELREALNDLNKDNAESVCWTSFMMTYVALKLLPEDQSLQTYVVPHQWLTMARAIAIIYRETLQWMQGWTTLDYLIRTAGPDFRDHTQVFDYNYGEPFRSLLNFDDGVEIMDEEARHAYDKALAYVAKVHSATITDHESYSRVCRRMVAIGPVVAEGFIRLVGEQRPRALAILAHHCAMMKAVDDTWFFRGVAQRELSGISQLLPAKWQWAMAWPRQTFDTIAPIDCDWHEEDDQMLTLKREVVMQS